MVRSGLEFHLRRSSRVVLLLLLSSRVCADPTPGAPDAGSATAASRADTQSDGALSPSPPGNGSTTLQRPTWGKVIGWVLDAGTRVPIAGAHASVEVDGTFPESGRSTCETDAHGRFVARAPLGKISSRFDWGRLLTMYPVSLLLSPRSVTKQTKIIDVTQVNVRVEAAGYQPFVGRVRATLVNPREFSVTLDDVWLAPGKSALVSFTPEQVRQEVIESLTAEPAVASPGQKVKVTLAARLPMDRGFRYRACPPSTAIRIVPDQLELKREKPEKAAALPPTDTREERVVFSREVTLPKSSIDRWTEVGFYLVRDEGTVLRQQDTKSLLQIAKTDEERAAAETIDRGYAGALAGDREKALQEYAAAGKTQPDYPLALVLYGDLCLQLNRVHDAASAYRRLVEQDPRDYLVARPRLALALIEEGNPTEALAQLADAEKVLGKQRLPAQLCLDRARAAAALGRFEEADKWLAKAGERAVIPDEMVLEINLKRMTAAVKASPENADLRLSYARVLQGARRREEAVLQVRKAVQLDPAQPWAFMDLGTMLWEGGDRREALLNLEHAVQLAPENVEALLALGDAYRDLGRYADALPLYTRVTAAQRLNLRARHNRAMMLIATGKTPEARDELLELTAQAREKGDLVEKGLFIPGMSIYFGPKRRLVSGFSVPKPPPTWPSWKRSRT